MSHINGSNRGHGRPQPGGNVTRNTVTAASVTLPADNDELKRRLDLSQGWEPFLANEAPQWTKFTLLKSNPDDVLFQNVNQLKFHYDFGHKYLEPFKAMTPEQFEAATMGDAGQTQQATLGSVITATNATDGTREIGLQLEGRTPIDADSAIAMLKKVKAAITPEDPAKVRYFYFPSAEQALVAQNDADKLRDAGFPIGSTERWARGNQIYSSHWGMGRLKSVPGQSISDAYGKGELRAGDVLYTDRTPAEVSTDLGAVLSSQAGTPNSHVAILARSLQTPYAYLRDEKLRAQVEALEGKQVYVRANADLGLEGTVSVRDLSGASAQVLAQLEELKKPAPLAFTPKEKAPKIGFAISELGSNDLRFVGGKAANYAVLSRALPQSVVGKAAAFSFNLWDGFMAQQVESTDAASPGKVSLAQEVAFRLKDFQGHPPKDVLGLRKALDEVKGLIRGTELAPGLKKAIDDTLSANFPANARLRFRSSTNLEDTDSFTGAGLYDSFGGRPGARAYEAVQNAMASFYNENAYLERLRRGVDVSKTGLAILVNESFSNDDELANGVATVKVDSGWYQANLVTQLGSASVTNPEPGDAKPESAVVSGLLGGQGSASVYVEQYSDAKELRKGDTVMRNEVDPATGEPDPEKNDYVKLGKYLLEASQAFMKERKLEAPVTFDLEFKRMRDGNGSKLAVKQIRVVPANEGSVPAVVLGEKATLQVFQGESGDVFSNHLGKSRWQVEVPDAWLSGPRADGKRALIERAQVEYVDGGKVTTKDFDGPLASFKRYSATDGSTEHTYERREKWDGPLGDVTGSAGAVKTDNELISSGVKAHAAEYGPVSELGELGFAWNVAQSKLAEVDAQGRTKLVPALEVQDFGPQGQPKTAPHKQTSVRLAVPREPDTRSLQDKWLFASGSVKIQPRFYYAKARDAAIIEKTASLGAWAGSTIEGLTTKPITLKGYFSQTMRPGHHNFYEEFIFEPRLELERKDLVGQERAELEASLAELEKKDIHRIYLHSDRSDVIIVSGRDGKWRKL